jgi:hypothetical protein
VQDRSPPPPSRTAVSGHPLRCSILGVDQEWDGRTPYVVESILTSGISWNIPRLATFTLSPARTAIVFRCCCRLHLTISTPYLCPPPDTCSRTGVPCSMQQTRTGNWALLGPCCPGRAFYSLALFLQHCSAGPLSRFHPGYLCWVGWGPLLPPGWLNVHCSVL